MELSPAKRALLEKWLQGQTNDDIPGIPRRPLNSPIPLSFPQQRQLFLEMLEQGTAVNNLFVFLELRGKADLVALEQSANQIIARHEVLRTHFSFGQGIPAIEVLPELMITLSTVDLQEIDVMEQVNEARLIAEKEVLKPFDLTQAPLIRLRLYILSNEKQLLLIVVHHTIADGWSLGIFLRELLTFYQAITRNKSPQVAELPIQYADFAHWQTDHIRGKVLKSSMDYWIKQLAGELPVLELPTDQQRGARQNFAGGTHRFELSSELMEALEKLSRQEDATLFMTLLAAFYTLLHRFSGQDDILVGAPVANRNLPELEHLIGVFINTIVLRINLSGDPGFRELIKRVRDVSLEAYAHQDLPFEQLVEELKPKRDLSRTPVFQVVFNMQNSPMPELEIPGIEMKFLEINRGVSQFDLTFMLSKSKGKYHGTVEYNNDLFKPATVTRMFQSFQMLLESAITQPDCPISRLPIVTKEELHRLVYELNLTSLDYPHNKCVHQLFEAQAERTPDAVAVIFEDTQITYSELNRRSNVLARHLQSLGVGPGIRVGILMKKSLEIVETLFAVLKAGGTYVPMHPSFPKERVQFILKDANVQVLMTNIDIEPPEHHKVHLVNLNDKPSTEDDCSNPATNIASDDLAYIIFTSGSTGRPKGVMIHHAALVNFLWSMRLQPGINKNDVLLSVTSVSFDIAALELFLPLIVGATVVIAGEKMIGNPSMIAEAISYHNVNIMQATPAVWQLLLDTGWTGEAELKALCGGEVLTRGLADQLLDRVGSLWNMYGPTETTVWSSVSQVQKGDTAITIGQPIGNTQLYVLDRHLKPMPISVAGELHIGGEGLAKGYLNHPDLTNEKFIPDCFSSIAGARLYKTGDHARYLPDYSIELLERMDDQVKMNGHRIELGEIAAVLMQHPSVHYAIAIARAATSGDKRLVAYYVPTQDQPADTDELQDFLRQKLPAYMIPAVIIRMNALPLTPGGKIDRMALPVPGNIRQQPGYVAPRNKVEQTLTSIWQDVLGVEQVGIHDNFFDLGGASIQSIQIVAAANISGLRLSVENVFEYQTIAGLAAQIKG
ncbi:amino acid adenylation domain-containing protein [Ferruginibacter paludis]|uniref:non-ribosomal peptide synthetase n=1 Tax=Ferruginibacter paludis TaxID=1310417 RepID=UPI0025B331B6|nr:amino acid adenylation domain-containing protein [Ferruginibacter paludis]MDN3658659.1 amino acid adenylation domain-containing protein [Ferruginibacter paludis]